MDIYKRIFTRYEIKMRRSFTITCRLYKRRFIKAALIIFITITFLDCFYFEKHYLSVTKPFQKLISSFDTAKETFGRNDETKALVQLRVKLSEISLRSDEGIDGLSRFLGSELAVKRRNEKPQRKDSFNKKYKVFASKDLRYQATQAKAQNVGDEIGNRVRTNHVDKVKELDVNLHKPTKFDQVTNAWCPDNTLGNMSSLVSYGKCKPHRASEEACEKAQELYYLQPPKCEDRYTGEICRLNVSIKNNEKILKARCNRKLCRQEYRSFVVKTLNPKNGQHDVIHTFSSINKLEKGLPLIMEHSRRNEYNYVFLQCKGKSSGSKVVQLLPIDPRYTIKDNDSKPRHKRLLNVNIILIDSVARAHFYRSLPKTINVFKRWIKDSAHSPARVFDFELFQAVEGHTAENTHALFTGKLFPKSIDRNNPPAVEMEHLFGHYKKAGYQTSWQEDLCWEGQWGLFVDLALSLGWNYLAPKLKDVFIDTTGITHSSCEVLKKYGLFTPFNGPKGHRICYNGKFQHSYFLKYNLDTLQAIASNPNALPLLSYISLSVGHDQYGRRIQTFDEALSQYVQQVAQDPNTVTIVLADHGNTYTEYTATTLEGRFEMFHPSLFIIIPNEVAKMIGKDAINSLTTNQRRLVTMIDLHKSLMVLADPVPTTGIPPRGVFTPVSPERTCDNVELRTPNLCVCDGWDSPTTNDTLKLAMVEFAVGELNNKLAEWFIEKQRGFPLTRSCNRLQPIGFRNVRERNPKTDDSLITSFDIIIPAGDVVPHQQETFRVEVKTNVSPDSQSLGMALLHYDRLTMFGPYSACADKDINLKLCVCSKLKRTKRNTTKSLLEKLMVWKTSHFVDSKVRFETIDEEGCLTLIERVHGKGDAYAYELANTCMDQSYTVVLEMNDMYNIKVSRDGPIETKVAPGSVRFVFSARKSLSYYQGQISVQVVSIK